MTQAQLQNEQRYLEGLVQNGSTGNTNWAKSQLGELQKYLGSSSSSSSGPKSSGSSGSIYSGMTQAQLQNEQKYLNKLVQNGTTGNTNWAKSQLNELQKYLGSSSSGNSGSNSNNNNNLSYISLPSGSSPMYGSNIYGLTRAAVNEANNIGYINSENWESYGGKKTREDVEKEIIDKLTPLGYKVTSQSGNGYNRQTVLTINDGNQYASIVIKGGTAAYLGDSSMGQYMNGSDMSSVLANYGYANNNFGKSELGSAVLNSIGTTDANGHVITREDALNYLASLGVTSSPSTSLGDDTILLDFGNGLTPVYLMNGNGLSRNPGGGFTYTVDKDNKATSYNYSGYIQPPTSQAGAVANNQAATDRDLWLENQRTYLNNLIQNGTQGQAAWAKDQLQNLKNSSGSLVAGSSGTNYSGMTQAQLDNQRAYLNNLINNGTTGQATWAHKELQNLNLASASNPNNASLGKDGYWYYNSNNGGAPVRNDYSQLIKDTYNTQADLYKQANNLAVESAVQKLRDTYQNGLAKYQAMRDQTAIDTAKSLDSQALMSQLNGDYGGLGNKQYGVLQAAGADQLLQINLEQQNLLNTTEQQVAQLVMEGKIEEAKMLAELAQSQMDALINEGDKVYQSYFNAYTTDKDVQFKEAELLGTYKGKETVASKQQNFQNALTRLQMGIFSESDAKALGIPANQAKQYADYINTLAQLDLQAAKADLANATSSGGRGVSTSGGDEGIGDDGIGDGGIGDGGIGSKQLKLIQDKMLNGDEITEDEFNLLKNGGYVVTVGDEGTGVDSYEDYQFYRTHGRPPFKGSTYKEAVAYIKQYGDETERERASGLLDSATFARKKNAASITPFNIPGTDIPITDFKSYQDYLKYMTGSY